MVLLTVASLACSSPAAAPSSAPPAPSPAVTYLAPSGPASPLATAIASLPQSAPAPQPPTPADPPPLVAGSGPLSPAVAQTASAPAGTVQRPVEPAAPIVEFAPAAPVPVAAVPAPLGGVAPAGWRLLIPEIGVNSPIVDVGLDPDGAMAAPPDPDVLGWYRYGGQPGGAGNALIGGHVDWTDRATGIPRGAAFFRLRQLNAGSRVTFTDGATEVVYQVAEKYRFRDNDPAAVRVLQPSNDSRLTLITCGGLFDRTTRSYDQRDVIIALRVT